MFIFIQKMVINKRKLTDLSKIISRKNLKKKKYLFLPKLNYSSLNKDLKKQKYLILVRK